MSEQLRSVESKRPRPEPAELPPRVYGARRIFVGEGVKEFDEWLTSFANDHAQARLKGYVLDLAKGALLATLDLSDVSEEVHQDIEVLVAERDDATATRALYRLLRDCNPTVAPNVLTCNFARHGFPRLEATCQHFPSASVVWRPSTLVACASLVAASSAGTSCLTPTLHRDEQSFLTYMKIAIPLILEKVGIDSVQSNAFLQFLEAPSVVQGLLQVAHVRDEIGRLLSEFCQKNNVFSELRPEQFLDRRVMDNVLWQVAANFAQEAEEKEENKHALREVRDKLQRQLSHGGQLEPIHIIDTELRARVADEAQRLGQGIRAQCQLLHTVLDRITQVDLGGSGD